MLLVKNDNFITYEQDIRALLNSFYPGQEIVYEEADQADQKNQIKQADQKVSEVNLNDAIRIDIDELLQGVQRFDERFDDKTSVKKQLYLALSKMTGKQLPWGTLTGIRPVRIVEKYEKQVLDSLRGAGSEVEASKADAGNEIEASKADADSEAEFAWAMDRLLDEKFLISDEKKALMQGIYSLEKKLLGTIDYENGYSIYIGIPFCPTRCVYCSFTAYPFAQWKERAYEYIDAVGRELRQLRELSAGDASNVLAGKKLQTIYVGGGTPSVLEPEMIDRLMQVIEENADISGLVEFTYEAGRPDTITREKLEVLRKHGVTRISINPQSMQQKTLDLIGRKHTVEDIRAAYRLARSLGFSNINMDIIAGLPGEELSDVRDTLEQISGLDPDSLTVHALAVKRASRLNVEGNAWGGLMRKGLDREGIDEVSQMTALGADYAAAHAMAPYYLYRQKNMAGNQENVGYAKAGKENLYNILMMEEKHTVIGVGAGSSTKVVLKENGVKQVKRFENMKNVAEYLSRTEELLEKRKEFLKFL